tara:strand:+ start:35 stop:1102 length:1068 start_codon:yes stop_codon:yes gene_type:complete
MNSLPLTLLRLQEQSKKFVFLQLTFFIIGLVSIIYFVVFESYGVLGVFYGKLVVSLVSFIVLNFTIKNNIIISFNFPETKKMLLFGLPLIPQPLGKVIIHSSDRYFLNYFYGLEESGLYNLAYVFATVATILIGNPFGLVWRPISLSHKDSPDSKVFFARSMTYLCLLGSLLTLALSLLSREIIMIIAPEVFWSAHVIVPILVVAYFLYTLQSILLVPFDIKRNTKLWGFFSVIGASTNIILNLLLIPKYGIYGASLSTLFSFSTIIFLTFYFGQKRIKIDYEWRRILHMFTFSLLIFLAGFYIVFDSILISILIKSCLIFLFPFSLYLSNFFNKNEIKALGNFFKKNILRRASF